jgi:hypothetical protein
VASTHWVNAWHAGRVLPTDLYLDAVNGDDSNSGFSAAAAKKTVSGLESLVSSAIYIKPQSITIHVKPGTYGSIQGVTGLELVYDFSSGAKIGATNIIGTGKTVVLCGTVEATGTIYGANSALIRLGTATKSLSLTFNNVSTVRFFYANSAKIARNYSSPSVVIQFTGTCSASEATVSAAYNGGIQFLHASGTTTTWSGSVTGKRYLGIVLSYIDSVGGANVIPGTIAGSVDSSSVFS